MIKGDIDFYHKLRRKVTHLQKTKTGKNYQYADFLLLVPDFFHLVCRLLVDKEVSAKYKIELGLLVGYFIMPFDIIPDFLGPSGFMDDLGLTLFILNKMVNQSSEVILLRNWAGSGDVLFLIKNGLNNMSNIIGSKNWIRTRSFFERRKFV